MSTNPWLDEPALNEPSAQLTPVSRTVRLGPPSPQPGVPAPDVADRLPRRTTPETAAAWWVGTHGGAGESTLAALIPGTKPSGHTWPIPEHASTANRVVLVARTNYAGLVSAQRAATEWASGSLGDTVTLHGLVLVADAPGRLPKPLRDLAQIIGGGVPRLWRLPFIETWRTGPINQTQLLPRELRALSADLDLTDSTEHHRKDLA